MANLFNLVHLPPSAKSMASDPGDGVGQNRAGQSRPGLLILGAVFVLALLATLFVIWQQHYVSRLRHLPEETRQELYSAAMAELRGICLTEQAATGPLRKHCLEQASFVALLPECQAGCRAAVDAVEPSARK